MEQEGKEEKDPKSRPPRWILTATALAALVTAVFGAAIKYYEFHKARAEVAQPQEKENAKEKSQILSESKIQPTDKPNPVVKPAVPDRNPHVLDD